jgi:glucose-6-phosphate isomerase
VATSSGTPDPAPAAPPPAGVLVDFATARLSGPSVADTARTVGDLAGVFADAGAHAALPPDQVVYRVQIFAPVPEGTPGGLLWGNTVVEPGRVGDEYFMTKGHFHAERDRGEFYVTAAGEGALLLMDEARRTRWEPMRPGSVHYIPGHTAHRVANTGDAPLAFLACWPSDAGHDYAAIARDGFGARLLAVGGRPTLVPDGGAAAAPR